MNKVSRNSWNKSFLVIVAALFCFFSLSAHSQWDHTNTRTITLELNKGILLHLDKNTGSVFVADPALVDFHLKAPGLLYVYSKKLGTTSLFVANKQNRVIYKFNVRVTHNLSELRILLKEVLPSAHVQVKSVGDNIVLRGTVKSAAQSLDVQQLAAKYVDDPKKVLAFLHVTSPTQINLRVQVIEMTREIIRALGINWSASFQTANNSFIINPILMPANFAANTGVTPNAVQFSSMLKSGNFSIQALVNVLEHNGLVTILSEPNLTALSGETASFLVGGEFPIPIPQGNTGAVTVMFKKFGVSLAFTPTILENGKINLQVRPEVSQLSTEGAVNINGFQVPSLSTRRAQTTVELRSGQSFSIAGLLQNNANKIIEQLPGISNVPILGRLFRSEQFKRDETELVIIVTPYIVEPAGNEAFLYPTDNANADQTQSYSTVSKRKNIGFILD